MPHEPQTMDVSAPHLYTFCPEGATAKLVCALRGVKLHAEDQLKRRWLFTPHSQQRCREFVGPRNNHPSHRGNQPETSDGAQEQDFWITLENVTIGDQGRYCCVVLEHQKDKRISGMHHGGPTAK
ncbi:hypothetical protein CRUP_021205 [Coryphaenoides rupestris]|nr:hypothetical protein CRUP_021205 [Coryphaenoides rupestris]